MDRFVSTGTFLTSGFTGFTSGIPLGDDLPEGHRWGVYGLIISGQTQFGVSLLSGPDSSTTTVQSGRFSNAVAATGQWARQGTQTYPIARQAYFIGAPKAPNGGGDVRISAVGIGFPPGTVTPYTCAVTLLCRPISPESYSKLTEAFGATP